MALLTPNPVSCSPAFAVRKIGRISALFLAVLGVALAAPPGANGAQSPATQRQARGQVPTPLAPSLSALINADRELVQLRDLAGAERDRAIRSALETKDFGLVREQLASEKFELDETAATAIEARYSRPAMSITIVSIPGRGDTATKASVTVAVASNGTSLTVAQITNLGTALEIHPSGYPVFYIRMWVLKDGRLIPWRYWWYDSHHHPNWFYSSYYWYWRSWWYYRNPWPHWYNWFWGWYYGYYWNYWSTWFPW